MACQCASMRPGIKVRPPQSMVCEPSGAAALLGSTDLILSPSTSTCTPWRSEGETPSKRRMFVKRTGRVGSAGTGAVCALPRSGRPRLPMIAVMPARNPRRDRSAIMRQVKSWTSGAQHAHRVLAATASHRIPLWPRIASLRFTLVVIHHSLSNTAPSRNSKQNCATNRTASSVKVYVQQPRPSEVAGLQAWAWSRTAPRGEGGLAN